MASGWIKALALPVLLLTLLAACQSGPNPRNQTQGQAQGPSYSGCGYYYPCAPRRVCPPGYVLARVPYSYGGPGRYCKPHIRRCCAAPPPPCGPSGPCAYGGGYPRVAY